MQAKTVFEGFDKLGEGPLWHPTEKVFYWVDVLGKKLHCLDVNTQQHQAWLMPDIIGCAVPCEQGGLLAGIGTDICHIDLPSGAVKKLKSTGSTMRLNDGKCDRQGRFWIGEVDDNGTMAGRFYRYDPDGQLHVILEGVGCSNGLDWSADNTQFYYTDSFKRKIFQYDFDAEQGSISNPRILVDVPESFGYPDGMTLDSEGCLWSACWDGAKVVRYKMDGSVDQEVALPTGRITSCAFGGSDLKTLYVTSCSQNVGEEEALPAPAGAVFAIELDVPGLLVSSFSD